MGMTTKLTLNSNVTVQLAAARRRGMVDAAEHIRKLSDARAPYEDKPRHEVHMRDTSSVRLEAGRADGDRVAIGYEAFWAVWQHENHEWHHEHGEAGFLANSLIEGSDAAFETVAKAMREAGT